MLGSAISVSLIVIMRLVDPPAEIARDQPDGRCAMSAADHRHDEPERHRVAQIAALICQNTSWPREVVPSQYSAEGGMSGGSR